MKCCLATLGFKRVYTVVMQAKKDSLTANPDYLCFWVKDPSEGLPWAVGNVPSDAAEPENFNCELRAK